MLITNLFIVRIEALWTDPRQKISNKFSEKYEKIIQMSENVNQKSDSFLKYAVGVTTTKISLWCFYFTHSSNFFSTFPSYYPLWLYTFLLLQISLKQSSQKEAVVLDWVTGFYCFTIGMLEGNDFSIFSFFHNPACPKIDYKMLVLLTNLLALDFDFNCY